MLRDFRRASRTCAASRRWSRSLVAPRRRLRHQGPAARRRRPPATAATVAPRPRRRRRHRRRRRADAATPARRPSASRERRSRSRDGELHAEGVPLAAIAERFGTPCYVYSRAALEGAWRAFDAAFAGVPHLVCYAMKANSNLAVLDLFARLGSGFDIVSGGELARVRRRGRRPAQGRVLRRRQDRRRDGARRSTPASCASTSNRRPSSSASTRSPARAGTRRAGQLPRESRRRSEDPSVHLDRAQGEQVRRRLRRRAARSTAARARMPRHRDPRHRHPHRLADHRARALPRGRARRCSTWSTGSRAEGIALAHVDLGGGLGIRYRDEAPLPLADYAAMLRGLFARRAANARCSSRAAARRRRRRAAHAGRVPEAGRREALRDRRRGDERPAAPRALRRVASRVDPVRPRAGAGARWEIVGPVCESARLPRARPRARARAGRPARRRARPARTRWR